MTHQKAYGKWNEKGRCSGPTQHTLKSRDSLRCGCLHKVPGKMYLVQKLSLDLQNLFAFVFKLHFAQGTLVSVGMVKCIIVEVNLCVQPSLRVTEGRQRGSKRISPKGGSWGELGFLQLSDSCPSSSTVIVYSSLIYTIA